MFSVQLTPDLSLKLATRFDTAAHFDFLERNRVHFNRFLRFIKSVRTEDDMREFVTRELAALARGEGVGIGIWKDGKVIGRIAVKSFQAETKAAEKIEIYCDPENAASAGLARRLGFVHEGTLRRAFANNDRVNDVIAWGLLRSEWNPRPSTSAS